MRIPFTPKIFFYLLVAAGIAWAIWYYHFVRTPEYLVRKQILAIAEDVNKNPQETNSIMAIKSVSLLNRLASHVEVSVHGIPIGGGYSGEELGSHVARARMYMEYIDLKPVEIYVELADESHAVAQCEVIAKASGKENTWRIDEIYHLRLSLELDSAKNWVFTGFHESEFIEK